MDEVTYNKPITLSQPSTRHQTPKLSLDTASQTSAITAELMAAPNPLTHPASPSLIDHGHRHRLRQRVLCDAMIDLAASFWAQNVHSLSVQHRLVWFSLDDGDGDAECARCPLSLFCDFRKWDGR